MEKLKELNDQEKEFINGGILPLVGVGVRFIALSLFGTAAVELVTEGWDSVKKDFKDGYNEVRIR